MAGFMDFFNAITGRKTLLDQIKQLNLTIVNMGQTIASLQADNFKLTQELINLENAPAPDPLISTPRELGRITINEAYTLLSSNFPTAQIFLSDSYYSLTSMQEASIFSNETKVAAQKYISEGHDCDNFSFALLGYWSQGLLSFAFGAAWSQNHAFNLIITDKKEVYLIEPQTNKYFSLAEVSNNPTYSNIRMIIM